MAPLPGQDRVAFLTFEQLQVTELSRYHQKKRGRDKNLICQLHSDYAKNGETTIASPAIAVNGGGGNHSLETLRTGRGG